MEHLAYSVDQTNRSGIFLSLCMDGLYSNPSNPIRPIRVRSGTKAPRGEKAPTPSMGKNPNIPLATELLLQRIMSLRAEFGTSVLGLKPICWDVNHCTTMRCLHCVSRWQSRTLNSNLADAHLALQMLAHVPPLPHVYLKAEACMKNVMRAVCGRR